MIGLIQKILLDLVESRGGRAGADEVKRRAGVPIDRTFRLDTVYPDDEWQALFAAACEVLALPRETVLEAYADCFCRDALERWPTWFRMSRTARAFLERQPVIHNCFATGVRDPDARRAVTDKFLLESRVGELVTHYRSPNQLCDLYRALARWILRHYGEEAAIEEVRCMQRGDPECEMHIRWARAQARA
jgi:hypothetical protein